MNQESVVTIDIASCDYEELCELLSLCAAVLDGDDLHGKELARDFRYFVDLLHSNRR